MEWLPSGLRRDICVLTDAGHEGVETQFAWMSEELGTEPGEPDTTGPW